MDPKTYKFDTLSLHAGYQPEKNSGSRQVPIYQTTSYLFDDVDHAAALFNLERGGHIYSRISNPTVAVLEERVAALEGGTAAIATSSGMSAIFLAIMTLCESGDHLVVSSQLYGGTVNLFRLTLPKFGINCTFVKPRDTEGFKNAIQENTKAIFGELVGNPGNELMKKAEEKDVGILVRVPEASGILTGKVNAETKIDEKDHRSVRKGEWIKASLEKVEKLKPIAERNDLTITELSMKFIMSKKGFASVFPTVVSEEEIVNYVEMTKGGYISASDMKEIEELYNTWPSYELKATPQTS